MCLCLSGALFSCQPASAPVPGAKEAPVTIRLTDYGHSAADAKQYLLSRDSLFVYEVSALRGQAAALLYRRAFPSADWFPHVSPTALLSLKNRYQNSCVVDGSLLMVSVQQHRSTKTIQLQNAYQEPVGQLIRHLNTALPPELQIWYNKEELLRGQEQCEAALAP